MIWINWQLTWKYYIWCTYSKLIYTIKDGCSFKNVIRYDFTMHLKGGSSTGAPGPSPPVRNVLGVCIYLNCIHHTMFTICPLFSTLTTKHRVLYVWRGHQNKCHTPRIYRARTTPPHPLLKIPGSATASNATLMSHNLR